MGTGRALLYLYTVWTITCTARQPTHARIGEQEPLPKVESQGGEWLDFISGRIGVIGAALEHARAA
jgi:hypothetical protein